MESRRFNYKQFVGLGELSFPRSIRTYLDGASSEYGDITADEKIFHFAFLFTHGYDVKSDIQLEIDRQKEKPQYGDYLDTVRRSIVHYISYVRNNGNDDGMDSVFISYLSLSGLIDLLREELLLRYREYVSDC